MSRSSDKPLRKARAGGLGRNLGEPRPLLTRGYGGVGPAKDGSRGGTPPDFTPPARGPVTVTRVDGGVPGYVDPARNVALGRNASGEQHPRTLRPGNLRTGRR
jgi:hypothetical protein